MIVPLNNDQLLSKDGRNLKATICGFKTFINYTINVPRNIVLSG
jgi:hypothetical protein